jgi:hypothetical protein
LIDAYSTGGDDRRDAKLWLDDIDDSRRAGVDAEPALREVAALSNREAPYSCVGSA